jgi:hypothetical protein
MPTAKTFPNAIRIALVAFAFFLVIGAVSSIASGQIPWYFGLAAFPIAAAWGFVGYWGKLPLVSTAAPLRRHGTHESLDLQVAVIRRRKLIAHWALLIWFPLAAIVMAFNIPLGIAIFASGALLSGVYGFLWQFSKCPRCHHGFNSQTLRGLQYWNTHKCQHCSLHLRGSQHEKGA